MVLNMVKVVHGIDESEDLGVLDAFAYDWLRDPLAMGELFYISLLGSMAYSLPGRRLCVLWASAIRGSDLGPNESAGMQRSTLLRRRSF
jgi:hypothetical protein